MWIKGNISLQAHAPKEESRWNDIKVMDYFGGVLQQDQTIVNMT